MSASNDPPYCFSKPEALREETTKKSYLKPRWNPIPVAPDQRQKFMEALFLEEGDDLDD